MNGSRPPPSSRRRLTAYLGAGLFGGAGYAALNTYFDNLVREGTLPAALAAAHGFVDRGLPLVAGLLVGVAAHYLHLRSALARAEAQRAEDLGARLNRIERNEAVWIVAAATLHEVNNPLHTLGLLLDEVGDLAAGEDAIRNELLERARMNAERIQDHLAALRSVASSARPQVGVVPLGAIVAEVARNMAPLAAKGRIHLRLEDVDSVRAKGDPTFVRIIVENLTRNALEVLRPCGDSGVLAIAVENRDGCATVRVSDNGPGIPPDIMKALFEPLATKKPDGLGLGLAIARELARTMQGELDCVSYPGWTTSFVLRLPWEMT